MLRSRFLATATWAPVVLAIALSSGAFADEGSAPASTTPILPTTHTAEGPWWISATELASNGVVRLDQLPPRIASELQAHADAARAWSAQAEGPWRVSNRQSAAHRCDAIDEVSLDRCLAWSRWIVEATIEAVEGGLSVDGPTSVAKIRVTKVLLETSDDPAPRELLVAFDDGEFEFSDVLFTAAQRSDRPKPGEPVVVFVPRVGRSRQPDFIDSYLWRAQFANRSYLLFWLDFIERSGSEFSYERWLAALGPEKAESPARQRVAGALRKLVERASTLAETDEAAPVPVFMAVSDLEVGPRGEVVSKVPVATRWLDRLTRNITRQLQFEASQQEIHRWAEQRGLRIGPHELVLGWFPHDDVLAFAENEPPRPGARTLAELIAEGRCAVVLKVQQVQTGISHSLDVGEGISGRVSEFLGPAESCSVSVTEDLTVFVSGGEVTLGGARLVSHAFRGLPRPQQGKEYLFLGNPYPPQPGGHRYFHARAYFPTRDGRVEPVPYLEVLDRSAVPFSQLRRVGARRTHD